MPGAVAGGQPTLAESLGDVYKQINAPFGEFAREMLDVSTCALKADDATYSGLESSIAALVARRDALAAQVRGGLDQAQFGGLPLDAGATNSLIVQAEALLAQAAALDSSSCAGGGAGGSGGGTGGIERRRGRLGRRPRHRRHRGRGGDRRRGDRRRGRRDGRRARHRRRRLGPEAPPAPGAAAARRPPTWSSTGWATGPRRW